MFSNPDILAAKQHAALQERWESAKDPILTASQLSQVPLRIRGRKRDRFPTIQEKPLSKMEPLWRKTWAPLSPRICCSVLAQDDISPWTPSLGNDTFWIPGQCLSEPPVLCPWDKRWLCLNVKRCGCVTSDVGDGHFKMHFSWGERGSDWLAEWLR
jgi:hypothetical protein